MIPRYKDKPVGFISINTRDPDGRTKAEIKRYKIDFPVFYGRGQKINADFKVLKLPRLILVKSDKTVHLDVLFMKSDELQTEIDKLLESTPIATGNPDGEKGLNGVSKDAN